MSEPREPSYYEVALTNRQVLVAFVVLLVCLMAAFFAGVWVGQRGSVEAEVLAEATPDGEGGEGEGSELEEFKFFSEGGERAQEPRPLPEVAADPRPDTTLAEDVGQRYVPPAPADEESPGETADSSDPAEGDTPAIAEAPAATAERPAAEGRVAAAREESAGDLVIQVFSSADPEQARRVLERLRAGGFSAYLAPVEVDGLTMHRVRIGPFAQRSEAQAAAERVRKAFKLDTWITRSS